MRIFISILLIIFASSLFAQPNSRSDIQLAFQYYQSQEYEKAEVLFEKITKTNRSQIYFNYRIKCLVALKKYSESEKLIKKRIRRNKNDLSNYIELGNIYNLQNKKAEAEKRFEEVINRLPANRNTIIRIANSFLSNKLYAYSEKTYLKGRKLTKEHFHLEMANLYAYQRKNQQMINEYLDLLKKDNQFKQTIKNTLQSRISNDFDNNLKSLIKISLLKRIQKDSKTYVYNELLIWFFIQDKDFANAIIQAKALDRRLKEGGRRLLEIGSFAVSNKMFDEAKQAYNYVVKKGKKTYYYKNAVFGLLGVYYQQIILKQITDKKQINEIEAKYNNVVNEFGINVGTIALIKDFAHLQAFYLNKHKSAINLLKKTLNIPRLQTLLKGSLKIEYADILVLMGETDEAILEYAQVEKMNENNEIGHDAKFKRAKLSFYTGNFIWAQAQLDVLKASTSQLIANDAFQLSMLIKDNIGLDSNETALKYFATAEMMLQQNKTKKALILLDTLENNFNTHSLIDEVLFLKASIYEKQGKTNEQIKMLKKISEKYSQALLGDDAIYKLAQVYDYQLNNKEQAMNYYKKIMFDFKGSIYVVESRKRFRALRGDK